jgi:hypothetical protein
MSGTVFYWKQVASRLLVQVASNLSYFLHRNTIKVHRNDTLNSFMVWTGTKNFRLVGFSMEELVYKLKHNTQHKHPHHGKRYPPPAGQVF